MAPDRRVCRYYHLEKLLILCLHPRYWGSILPGANATATVATAVFLVGNLVYFPFFIYVAVSVTEYLFLE